ncbi:hypothetical protein [Brevibacterium litoralis]|uniref:hypothetical protein n=1 Tax=Brevibacterium litoralis TaxID=3138935 RepID=UPI0032EF08C1
MTDPSDRSPEDGQEDGPSGSPDAERAPAEDRVSDEDWRAVVEGLARPTGFVPEMSRDEIREALEDEEEWTPPPAPRVGWRTAAPVVVLGWLMSLGGVAFLLLGAIFFRPLPGWLVLLLVVIVLLGATILFLRLPKDRPSDPGSGAQV